MTREVSLGVLADSLAEGETVFIAGCTGEPLALTQRLVEAPDLAPGVCFITSFVPGINTRNLAPVGSTRQMQVFFMQPEFRESRAEKRVQFSPLNYFGIQRRLASSQTRIDTVVVHVSEPDAQGLCSLGPAVEFMPTVLRRDCRVLALINPGIPQLSGSVALPFERIARFARFEAPLATYDAGASNPVTDRIVAQLTPLIADGSTIQVGIGKLPAQLLPALHRHRRLGFHSGMLSDALLSLREAGCLREENALTAGVVVGSQQTYEQLTGVRDLNLRGVEYTHDPAVLSQLPRLHAVNSALEVDLLGQVNAEMLGGRYVSGPGGLPDFAAAAHRSLDGASIIVLPSTDPKGRVSRIVARLSPGTPVTVPQQDVDIVVTEYGVADLRGVTLDERVRRIAAIASPEFRPELQKASRRWAFET